MRSPDSCSNLTSSASFRERVAKLVRLAYNNKQKVAQQTPSPLIANRCRVTSYLASSSLASEMLRMEPKSRQFQTHPSLPIASWIRVIEALGRPKPFLGRKLQVGLEESCIKVLNLLINSSISLWALRNSSISCKVMGMEQQLRDQLESMQ